MQDYNTIIGSIQMRLNGCQTRSVMDRYKIGSGTLNLIMSRYHANGIPIEELRMMAPKEVENLFYPQKNLQRKDVPLPDFQYYYDRIHAPGSRMNISFCWLDLIICQEKVQIKCNQFSPFLAKSNLQSLLHSFGAFRDIVPRIQLETNIHNDCIWFYLLGFNSHLTHIISNCFFGNTFSGFP